MAEVAERALEMVDPGSSDGDDGRRRDASRSQVRQWRTRSASMA